MEMFITVFRTVFFYFFVMVCYRLMGKREVGQLSIIEVIVSLMIAELCVISIENTDESIFLAIVPIALLAVIQIGLGFLGIKSRGVRTFFSGKTSLIISHGVINYKEMVKLRYSVDDLLLALRQQSIKSIEDVEYAFLESNGKLSIFKYNCLKLPSSYPLPIVVDGKVQKETLKEIKKSELWLKFYLQRQDVILSNVFYAFYKNRKVYIIKQSEIKAKTMSKSV